MKEILTSDEMGYIIKLDVPYDDWELTVTNQGYEAWVHSPNKESGVAAWGLTKGEALLNLQKRLDAWKEHFND